MKKIEDQTKRAERIVKNHMFVAIAGELLPIRLMSAAAVAGVQLKMIHALSEEYGVEFSQNLGKSLIASLIGVGASLSITQNLAPLLLKAIPIIGIAASMITMSCSNAASTFAMGKVFILHFESGGTLLTFDAEKMKKHYADELKTGKNEFKKNYIGIKP